LHGSAVVAKTKNLKKADSSKSDKIRVTHTIDANLYRRFRVAAAETDRTESELFEWLINDALSSVHARGLPEKLKPGAGQGSPTDDSDQASPSTPTVRINTPLSRIDAIGRKATVPIDSAIDDFTTE
jgi:hypothetical protein